MKVPKLDVLAICDYEYINFLATVDTRLLWQEEYGRYSLVVAGVVFFQCGSVVKIIFASLFASLFEKHKDIVFSCFG